MSRSNRSREWLVLFASMFVVSGLAHFFFPESYLRIMPPWMPWAKPLVWISGAAEIAGGVGLMIPPTRRVAAYGLVALLLAVFPANLYTAAAHVPFHGLLGRGWLQWLRLPFQIPLIVWAWQYTQPDRDCE
jgi:uncharacterized membrane protein